MRQKLMVVAIASLAGVLGVSLFGRGHASPAQTSVVASVTGAKPVVVVELFTSEGCSSCPPADLLLKKLSEEQPIQGAQVVALEEHVDYWNRLGWTDPFSAHDYSQRQEDYARSLGNDGVYTPQMIVDGETEFTGSHAKRAREAIERSAGMPKIGVNVIPVAGEKGRAAAFDVQVQNTGAGGNSGRGLELWLAVTEKGLQSDVKAGENSGETLRHAAVVRSLHRLGPVEKEGSFGKPVSVELKKEWNRENILVVAFVVEKNSRKILGAGVSQVSGSN